MKTFFLSCGLLFSTLGFSQSTNLVLAKAFKEFEIDSQFKHASISLYVVDSKTGKVVFDKNSLVGLAPASCMKVFTSAAAFELLGKNFRYETVFGYNGKINNGILSGNLFLIPSGDPTFGSWRWANTSSEVIEQNVLDALIQKNISTISGNFFINDSKWETQATPGGWTWEDIGNYYGAGARGLNWHENQYDLILAPGKNEGDSVEILKTEPELQISVLINELKTGKAGSGDHSIIYLPENGLIGFVRGTVPSGNKTFKVSGSMPDASLAFFGSINDDFQKRKITLSGRSVSATYYHLNKQKLPVFTDTLFSYFSPTLDSINYWFMQKSINLYGEAFVKTIAFKQNGFGSTEDGLTIIRNFWKMHGIEKSALKMIDGSGLSPANRVTTKALVTAMQYAKKQNWFSSFYAGLPEQNSIKMKSGYINGVRSYTGYIKSKAGAEYTFSFIINNFDGNPVLVRDKMWKLLNILK